MEIDLPTLRNKVETAKRSGSRTALNVYEEQALIDLLESSQGSNVDRDGMVRAMRERDFARRDLAIAIAALRDIANTPSGDFVAKAKAALREIGVEVKK